MEVVGCRTSKINTVFTVVVAVLVLVGNPAAGLG